MNEINTQRKIMRRNSPDDFQTPPEALDCLLPFVPKSWNIWEPACGNGNLLGSFLDRGYSAIGTDVKEGHDFLTMDVPKLADAIITNPPFSIKDQFMARCYEIGLPFALLLPAAVFDSKKRRDLMKKNGVGIIIPDGRINFETPNHEENIKNGKKEGGAWFLTMWVTYGLDLPSQIVFE